MHNQIVSNINIKMGPFYTLFTVRDVVRNPFIFFGFTLNQFGVWNIVCLFFIFIIH